MRPVATIVRGPLRPVGGVVCIEWNGRDEAGAELPAGRYHLRVTRPGSTFLLERKLHIEPWRSAPVQRATATFLRHS